MCEREREKMCRMASSYISTLRFFPSSRHTICLNREHLRLLDPSAAKKIKLIYKIDGIPLSKPIMKNRFIQQQSIFFRSIYLQTDFTLFSSRCIKIYSIKGSLSHRRSSCTRISHINSDFNRPNKLLLLLCPRHSWNNNTRH